VRDERPNFASVSSLLLDTDFDDAKIVRLLNVTLPFVQKVRLVLAQ
jgi:hypothetical protein